MKSADFDKAWNALEEQIKSASQLADAVDPIFTCVYYDEDDEDLAAAGDVLGADE